MNYDIFKSINNLSGNSVVDAVMKFSAKYLLYVVFVVVAVKCLLLLRDRVFRPVIAFGVSLVLTFGLSRILAAAWTEQRPFQSHHVHELVAHASGQSFPSDHATAAFGIALGMAALISRRWGAWLFVVALLIGFARVYVGVHYPSDILGGLLAALVGVGVVAAFEYRRTRHVHSAERPAKQRVTV